jgi:DNA-directed RNA polymerase specialized sigma24 family protein
LLSDDAIHLIPAAPQTGDREAYLEELRDWAIGLVTRLPSKQWDAFRLCVLEARSGEDAATALNQSSNAVRFNLCAARKRLRALAKEVPPPIPGGGDLTKCR